MTLYQTLQATQAAVSWVTVRCMPAISPFSSNTVLVVISTEGSSELRKPLWFISRFPQKGTISRAQRSLMGSSASCQKNQCQLDFLRSAFNLEYLRRFYHYSRVSAYTMLPAQMGESCTVLNILTPLTAKQDISTEDQLRLELRVNMTEIPVKVGLWDRLISTVSSVMFWIWKRDRPMLLLYFSCTIALSTLISRDPQFFPKEGTRVLLPVSIRMELAVWRFPEYPMSTGRRESIKAAIRICFICYFNLYEHVPEKIPFQPPNFPPLPNQTSQPHPFSNPLTSLLLVSSLPQRQLSHFSVSSSRTHPHIVSKPSTLNNFHWHCHFCESLPCWTIRFRLKKDSLHNLRFVSLQIFRFEVINSQSTSLRPLPK